MVHIAASPHAAQAVDPIFQGSRPWRKTEGHTHLAKPLPLFSCTPTRQQTTHTHTSDRLGKNLVDELDVLCRWRKDGCKWGGQLQQWQSHSKTCLFNPSNQPEWLKPDSKSEGAIC